MELSLRGLGDITCPTGFTVKGAQCSYNANPTQLLAPADAANANPGALCWPGPGIFLPGKKRITGNYQYTAVDCGGSLFGDSLTDTVVGLGIGALLLLMFVFGGK
jgi:hypothetical protein